MNKVNPFWFYISSGIYLLIRIIEYSTGQVGTPEWAVDFFPYWAFLAFIIFDNVIKQDLKEGEGK